MTAWTDDEVGGTVWSDDEVGASDGTLTGAQIDVDADKIRVIDATDNRPKLITVEELVANTSSFTQSGSGPSATNLQAKIRRDVPQSPEDRGCVGDGLTDDTTNFGVFLNNASDRVNYLSGTYKLTSLLSKAISNAVFIGIPGKTKITGSFGYSILEFLDLANVHFYGIEFETTYSNATEFTGGGLVYSYQHDVENVSFRRCKFTAPDANTNGLSVFARIDASDTSATINGLLVEDCDFEDIGRMAMEFMNRNTSAYEAAQRVFVNRNRGKNLGTQGDYGHLISLDGYGSNFSIDHNLVDDAFGIGIEDTGWINGSISYNSFQNMTNAVTPLACSGRAMTGLSIIGNRGVDTMNEPCSFVLVNKSVFRDNYFDVDDALKYAVLFRDCNDNRMSGNYWKSNGIYSASFEASTTTCSRNHSQGDTFDNSGAGSNTATVHFTGANATLNKILAPVIMKGTGGATVLQASSATENYVGSAASSTDMFSLDYTQVNFGSDADITLTIQQYSGTYISFTDGSTLLTTGRNIVVPNMKRLYFIRNSTAQTLTVKTSAGSGIGIATNRRAIVFCDGTNVQRVTADTAG